jgi:hypothetical protein
VPGLLNRNRIKIPHFFIKYLILAKYYMRLFQEETIFLSSLKLRRFVWLTVNKAIYDDWSFIEILAGLLIYGLSFTKYCITYDCSWYSDVKNNLSARLWGNTRKNGCSVLLILLCMQKWRLLNDTSRPQRLNTYGWKNSPSEVEMCSLLQINWL